MGDIMTYENQIRIYRDITYKLIKKHNQQIMNNFNKADRVLALSKCIEWNFIMLSKMEVTNDLVELDKVYNDYFDKIK